MFSGGKVYLIIACSLTVYYNINVFHLYIDTRNTRKHFALTLLISFVYMKVKNFPINKEEIISVSARVRKRKNIRRENVMRRA